MKMNRQALAHVLHKFLVGDINVEKSRSRVVVPFQILICDFSKSSCHDWNEVLKTLEISIRLKFVLKSVKTSRIRYHSILE